MPGPGRPRKDSKTKSTPTAGWMTPRTKQITEEGPEPTPATHELANQFIEQLATQKLTVEDRPAMSTVTFGEKPTAAEAIPQPQFAGHRVGAGIQHLMRPSERFDGLALCSCGRSEDLSGINERLRNPKLSPLDRNSLLNLYRDSSGQPAPSQLGEVRSQHSADTRAQRVLAGLDAPDRSWKPATTDMYGVRRGGRGSLADNEHDPDPRRIHSVVGQRCSCGARGL